MPLVRTARQSFNELLIPQLKQMGVQVCDRSDPQLRIGLLNLMPAASRAKTSEQFFSLVGSSALNVTPIAIRFDEYVPKSGREAMMKYYEPFANIREQGLDGLIVTGANLELTPDGTEILPLADIIYHSEWRSVLDWARANVRSTIYSCLGAHMALEHFYGLKRTPLGTTTFNKASGTVGEHRKTFGLFNHRVDHSACPSLTRGMNDHWRGPQSRWGEVTVADIRAKDTDLKVVAESDQSGWQILAGPEEREIYLQGHPEYYPGDLKAEYDRDKQKGMKVHLPVDFFPGDDDTKAPICNWRADAHVFYRNWLALLNDEKLINGSSYAPGLRSSSYAQA